MRRQSIRLTSFLLCFTFMFSLTFSQLALASEIPPEPEGIADTSAPEETEEKLGPEPGEDVEEDSSDKEELPSGDTENVPTDPGDESEESDTADEEVEEEAEEDDADDTPAVFGAQFSGPQLRLLDSYDFDIAPRTSNMGAPYLVNTFEEFTMVGPYQLNATGGSNTYGKWDGLTLIGSAKHATNPAAQAAELALAALNYDMLPGPDNGQYTGGGQHEAYGRNSSSADLVPVSANARIEKAYLLITATAWLNNPDKLREYGVFFMGPDEKTIQHYAPETIYGDGNNRLAFFVDVTDFVQEQGYGTYTALNIPFSYMNGYTAVDLFGAWKLIVIEEDTDLPIRMVNLKLGGTSVNNASPAYVQVSADGLVIADNATGEFLFSMDGYDVDNTQRMRYTTNANYNPNNPDAFFTAIYSPLRPANTFYPGRIINRNQLVETDPPHTTAQHATIILSQASMLGSDLRTHNTDLDVMPINDPTNPGGIKLGSGQTYLEVAADTSNAPTLLAAIGLAVDIIVPDFESEIVFTNNARRYSTSDIGYGTQSYSQQDDQLTAIATVTNVSAEPLTGIRNGVVTLEIPTMTVGQVTSVAYFDGSSTRVVPVTAAQIQQGGNAIAVGGFLNTGETFAKGHQLTLSFKGSAYGSTALQTYSNRISTQGTFVSATGEHFPTFALSNLGLAYVNTYSDILRFNVATGWSGAGEVLGGGMYPYNETAGITVNPDPGHYAGLILVDGVVRDDLLHSTGTPFTIDMDSRDHEVYVVFKQGTLPVSGYYRVSTATDGNADITPTAMVPAGEDHLVEWTADPGYRVISVTLDGYSFPVADTGKIPFVTVYADHDIEVRTAALYHYVQTIAIGPGAISESKTVDAGSSYQVDWSADGGAVLSRVTIDGVVVYDEYNTGSPLYSHSFTDIDANHRVVAEFREMAADPNPPVYHLVETQLAGGLGTITPSAQVVDDGSITIEWDFDAAEYRLEYVRVIQNGVEQVLNVSGSQMQLHNIQQDTVVQVVLAPVTAPLPSQLYSITTSLYGGPGEIDPSATNLSSGSDHTVSWSAGAGYHVVSIVIDGVMRDDLLLQDATSYTFENIQKNHSVYVRISADPLPQQDYYSITTSISGNGSIDPSLSVQKGGNATIGWAANSPDTVVRVLVDGVEQSTALTSFTFTDVAANHTIHVDFSNVQNKNFFTILTQLVGGPGEITGSVTVEENEDHEVEWNITEAGYRIKSVLVDGVLYDADLGLSTLFQSVTNDHYVVVILEPLGAQPEPDLVAVYTSTEGDGVISNSSVAQKGEDVTVSWSANPGWRIAALYVDGYKMDDSAAQAGTLTLENLTSDHTVHVVFEENVPSGITRYTVTTSLHGGTGEITPSFDIEHLGSRTVSWNYDTTLFEIARVFVDGAPISAPSANRYEFIGVEDDHTIEVILIPLSPTDLTIEKTAVNLTDQNERGGMGVNVVGDIIMYTIKAKNNTPNSEWHSVVITDPLPTTLAFGNYTVSPDGALAVNENNQLELKMPAGTIIKGGEEITLTFMATILSSALDGVSLSNTAYANGTNAYGDPLPQVQSTAVLPNNTQEVKPLEPLGRVTKEIEEKTGSGTNTKVGDIISYSVTIENTRSDSAWYSISVKDTLPAGLSLIPGSIELSDVHGNKYIIPDAEFLSGISIGSIESDEKFRLIYKAIVTSSALVEDANEAILLLTNTAVATGTTPLGATHTRQATATPPGIIPSEPDGSVVKTVRNLNGASVTYVGDVLEYEITATNSAANSLWSDIILRDELPAGLSLVPGSLQVKLPGELAYTALPDPTGNVIEYTVAGLKGSESATLTFQAVVNANAAGGTDALGNTVTATGKTPEGEDHKSTDGPIYPPGTDGESGEGLWHEPAGTVNKSVNNMDNPAGPTYAGDTLSYAINVRNTAANSLWKNILLEDILPSGVAFVPGSASWQHSSAVQPTPLADGDVLFGGGTIRFTVARLYGGESATLTFKVVVLKEAITLDGSMGANIENMAGATGETPSGGTEEDASGKVTPPGPLKFRDPDMAITKAVANNDHPNGPTVVEDTLTYTITLANNGAGSLLAGAQITDTLPSGLTLVESSLRLKGPADADFAPLNATDVFNSGSNTITVPVGNMFGGDVYVLQFEAIVNSKAPLANANIANMGEFAGKDPDGEDEKGKTEKVNPPGPVLYLDPSMEISKAVVNTDNPNGPTVVDDTLTYTITLANTRAGSVLKDAVITDTLPAGLTLAENSLLLKGPNDAGFISLDPADVFDRGSSTLTVPLGDVHGGEVYTLQFSVTVNGKAPESLANVANIGRYTGVLPDGGDTAGETGKVYPPGPVEYHAPEGSVSKVVRNTNNPAGPTYAGDTLLYTITIGNGRADSLWKNVVIEDALPSGLAFVPGSASWQHSSASEATPLKDSEVLFGGDTIRFTIARLYGGESATLTFEAIALEEAITLDGSMGANIENVASATGETPGGGAEEDGTGKVTPPGPLKFRDPDMELGKAVENTSHPNGPTVVEDILTYTIMLSNKAAGSLIRDAVILDTLPAGLTLVEDSLRLKGPQDEEFSPLRAADVYNSVTSTITVPIGNIYGNETYTLQFEVLVNGQAPEKTANTANVGKYIGKDPDGKEIEDETGKTTPPGPVLYLDPEMEIAKTVENIDHPNGPTVVGDRLTYTITLTNTRLGSVLKDAVISDKLPVGLTLLEDSLRLKGPEDVVFAPLDAADVLEGSTIAVPLGDVYGGQSYVLQFEATVNGEAPKAAQYIDNTGRYTGTRPDGEDEEDGTEKISPPGPVKFHDPEMEIDKAVENTTNPAGPTMVEDILTYTLTLENTVPGSCLHNAVLNDRLPSGITLVEDSIRLKGPGESQFTPLRAGDVFDGRTLAVKLEDVYGGDIYVLQFEAKVNNQAPYADENVENTGWYTGTDPNGEEEDGETDTVTPPTPVLFFDPEMGIEKSVANNTNPAGPTVVDDVLTYTIALENTAAGSLLENARLRDRLPSGLTLVESSLRLKGPQDTAFVPLDAAAVFDRTTNTITVPLGNVYGNETWILEFEAFVNTNAVQQAPAADEGVANTGEYTGTTPDGEEERDETGKVNPPGVDEETGVEWKEPERYLAKQAYNRTHPDGPTRVNDVVDYSIVVGNSRENSFIPHIVLRDTLPVGVEIKTGTIQLVLPDGSVKSLSPTVYNTESRTLLVYLGTIAGGETYILRFTAVVTEEAIGREIGNIAGVADLPKEPGETLEPGDPYTPDEGEELHFEETPAVYPSDKDRKTPILPVEDPQDPEPETPAPDNTGDANDGNNTVNTGDTMNVVPYLVLAFLALCGITIASLQRRRLKK